MADTINISCPNCETPFEVPEEMIGETVECTECGTAFEITAPELQTSPDANEGQPPEEEDFEDPTSTNTVKMSRTSIGMVPTVQDSYELGVVDQQIEKTDLRKAFESGEFAFKDEGEGEGEETGEVEEKKDKETAKTSDKKWWKFWGK